MVSHLAEDVDVELSRELEKARRNAGTNVWNVESKNDEHGIWSHASRVDMLTRIGRFLDAHLAPAKADLAESRTQSSDALAATPAR